MTFLSLVYGKQNHLGDLIKYRAYCGNLTTQKPLPFLAILKDAPLQDAKSIIGPIGPFIPQPIAPKEKCTERTHKPTPIFDACTWEARIFLLFVEPNIVPERLK